MPLDPASRLGAYEIIGAIGAGGMGEVYRARDTKLGRDVAIKILPQSFGHDPDRVARFQREAQILAALNHPHIAAIYGLEESGATQFLVLELVDGETLAERLARPEGRALPASGVGDGLQAVPRGGMEVNEAISIARQIADALEAAHEKGIIHRDLKPANIALTADNQVKVLDFGLAKALDAGSGSELAHSPTLTFAATQAGMILGTAAYMSPEQARGRAVDKRSDIWAFGCVFYEMLAGKRAFEGEDVTDVIAAIVRGEPDWSALPSDLPEQIRLLIKRCLEKDRKARIADIGVARFLMTETIAQPPAPVAASSAPALPSRRPIVLSAGIGIVAGLAIAAIAARAAIVLRPVPSVQPVRFAIAPPSPQMLALQGADHKVAISPDGTHVIYRIVAGQLAGQLAVRALHELDSRLLVSATGREPFMSPDGRWIGFFTATELRKISITGGPSITLCRIPAPPRGASWGEDDTIVFSTNDLRNGLLSVSAGGGEPKALTTPDASKNEVGHLFPFVLPGGKAVLFTIGAGLVDNAQIAVLDLTTGQRKTLIQGGSDARYVDTGHLVYAAAGTLRAVRFDLARLEVLSDPIPVVEQVLTEATGAANFAVSRQGTLVYIPGGTAAQSAPLRSLVWVNRQGREEPINAPPRPYAIPRLSPDGRRVALDVRDQNNDIWIWDLARRTLTPLNLDRALDMSPVWTPDGRRIVWASTRGGGNPNLYWQTADGTGTAERLTTNLGAQFPTSMSADGTRVALYGGTGGGMAAGMDISLLTVDSSRTQRTAEPLIQSPATKFNGEISPDGRWIAYQSNESGQFQVYVRPFPRVDDGRWPISTEGGTRPAWSRNGRELFYLDGNDLLTSVPVSTTTTSFSAGTPTKILSTRYYAGASSRGYDLRGYDVSPDGQRFLMIKDNASSEQTTTPASMVVVLHWFEELKARVPGRRD